MASIKGIPRTKKVLNSAFYRVVALRRCSKIISKKEKVAVIGQPLSGRHTLAHCFRHQADVNFDRHQAVDSSNLQSFFVYLFTNPNFPMNGCYLELHILKLEREEGQLEATQLEESVRRELLPTIENYVLIYDVLSSSSLSEIGRIIIELDTAIPLKNRHFIVVGNKCDLLEEENARRAVDRDNSLGLAASFGARKFFSCSADNNRYIDPIFNEVISMCFEKYYRH